jgi:hypothetical protein
MVSLGRFSDVRLSHINGQELNGSLWALLDVPDAAELSAVKWRQQNLDKLTKEKRAELVGALEKAQPE